jgi:PAT family beta-lactamase induction signal transducer AmpG
LLTTVGFASGLPYALSQGTLQTWMKVEKIELATIGFFALVALPYNFKFLWAPLLDRYPLPFLGRRRGWMAFFLGVTIATIAGLGALGVHGSLTTVAVTAITLAFCSASLDIVVDAHRTDLLSEAERAPGTATHLTGYRIGLLVAQSGALILADQLPWRVVYFILAALASLGLVGILWLPEPTSTRPPASLTAAVVNPFRDYFTRQGALLTMIFILFFRFGDAIAATMTQPFFVEVGFTLTELGVTNKLASSIAGIGGTLLGAYLVTAWGLRTCLFVFGAAMSASNLLYAGLALTGKNLLMLIAAVSIDAFANGMGAAAFVAFLMSLCSKSYSATQYALLSGLATLLGRMVSSTSGVIAENAGWVGFYAITAVMIAPSLVLVWFVPASIHRRRDEAPAAAA